ncbi:MAG: BrnT family toxin [Candidatus Sumerlaeota bacterium]|nr:BrnT family toxin [Candidatus Sumerlaeota bacterium]
MTSARFEWDDNKDAENQIKHNVAFSVAQLAFLDPLRIIAEDTKHSQIEKRYYCIGKAGEEILTARFTYREDIIRIIGAGYWRKGKHLYETINSEKK